MKHKQIMGEKAWVWGWVGVGGGVWGFGGGVEYWGGGLGGWGSSFFLDVGFGGGRCF